MVRRPGPFADPGWLLRRRHRELQQVGFCLPRDPEGHRIHVYDLGEQVRRPGEVWQCVARQTVKPGGVHRIWPRAASNLLVSWATGTACRIWKKPCAAFARVMPRPSKRWWW